MAADWFPQLCRGEQNPEVVIQNGLLTDATQGEVLKKPGPEHEDQEGIALVKPNLVMVFLLERSSIKKNVD